MNIFSILTNFENLAPIWLLGTLDLAPRCSSVLATLFTRDYWAGSIGVGYKKDGIYRRVQGSLATLEAGGSLRNFLRDVRLMVIVDHLVIGMENDYPEWEEPI